MRLVKQPTKTTCGQSCIAMIKDVSVWTVIHDMGSGWTTHEKMLEMLGIYGEMDYGKPPYHSLSIQYHQQPNGTGGHWTIWNYGEVLDPACIEKLWPVSHHKVLEEK